EVRGDRDHNLRDEIANAGVGEQPHAARVEHRRPELSGEVARRQACDVPAARAKRVRAVDREVRGRADDGADERRERVVDAAELDERGEDGEIEAGRERRHDRRSYERRPHASLSTSAWPYGAATSGVIATASRIQDWRGS